MGDTDWHYLAQDRWFESLRDDPRFVALLEEMRSAAEPGPRGHAPKPVHILRRWSDPGGFATLAETAARRREPGRRR